MRDGVDSTSGGGSSPGAANLVGQRLGPYLVLEEIARGGQGIVLRARHEQLGQDYALKVLLDPEPRQIQRFQQEAQVLARLRHPNLLAVTDLGLLAGKPYLAMELVEGVDLAERVRTGGALDPEEIVRILEPIAQALHYCHGQGIVHRDLKPANVLLEAEGGRPVLVDFGLIKRDASVLPLEGLSDQRLSLTGEIMGTAAYMAPEQADSSLAPISPRTDVYALGATLYVLLTGATPYAGSTNVNVVVQLLKDTGSPDPLAANPKASPALAALCRHAMAKNQAERPASAAEFAHALRATLQAEPTSRSRVAAAALVLGALAIVVGAFLFTRPPAPATLDLTVDADGVEVWDGGRKLADASQGEPLALELSPGRHDLSLRRDGLAHAVSVDLQSGVRVSKAVTLKVPVSITAQVPGTVFVSTKGGEVLLDGVPTPTVASLPLGRYRVRLEAPDHLPLEASLEARVGAAPPTFVLTRTRYQLKGDGRSYPWASDVDEDGITDLICVEQGGGAGGGARLVAYSGRSGAELWAYAYAYQWSNPFVQREPVPAILVAGNDDQLRPRLAYLDPRTGSPLRPPTFLAPDEEPRYAVPLNPTPLDPQRSGSGGVVLLVERSAASPTPSSYLLALDPEGVPVWRVNQSDVGPPGKHAGLRPWVYDVDGDGDQDVVWKYGNTYYGIVPGEQPRVEWALRSTTRSDVGYGWAAQSPPGVPSGLVLGWRPRGGVTHEMALVTPARGERWRATYEGGPWGHLSWLPLGVPGGLVVQMCVMGSGHVLRLIDAETGAVKAQVVEPRGFGSFCAEFHAADGRRFLAVNRRRPLTTQLLSPRDLSVVWESPQVAENEDDAMLVAQDFDGDGQDELLVSRPRGRALLVLAPQLPE